MSNNNNNNNWNECDFSLTILARVIKKSIRRSFCHENKPINLLLIFSPHISHKHNFVASNIELNWKIFNSSRNRKRFYCYWKPVCSAQWVNRSLTSLLQLKNPYLWGTEIADNQIPRGHNVPGSTWDPATFFQTSMMLRAQPQCLGMVCLTHTWRLYRSGLVPYFLFYKLFLSVARKIRIHFSVLFFTCFFIIYLLIYFAPTTMPRRPASAAAAGGKVSK